MNREEIIKAIIEINKEFSTRELFKHLGGKDLTIEEKRVILETIDTLFEEGVISHRLDGNTLIYMANSNTLRLKMKNL